MRLVSALLLWLSATAHASDAPGAMHEITFQISAQELGLDCVHASGSPDGNDIVMFKIHVLSPLAGPAMGNDSAVLPQVRLSVISGEDRVITSVPVRGIVPATSKHKPIVERLMLRRPTTALIGESIANADPPDDDDGLTMIHAQRNSPRVAEESTILNVFVDDLLDGPPNATSCARNIDGADETSYSGECNLRSAFEYCSGIDRGDFEECAVHLPETRPVTLDISLNSFLGAIFVDPILTSASLSLHGNGQTIAADGSIRTTQLFVVRAGIGSTPDGFFFRLYDATLSGFGDDFTDGGAVVAIGAVRMLFDHVAFTDNRGADGGAVFIKSVDDVVFLSCSFIANSASNDGGAVRLFNSNASLLSLCIFEDNSANDGGAVSSWSGDYLAVFNSTFTGNKARYAEFKPRADGAGIFIEDSLYVSVENCLFNRNNAHIRGGGVAILRSNYSSVSGSTFGGNNALDGGGLSIEEAHDIFVLDCSFLSNIATRHGAGLFTTNVNRVQVKRTLVRHSLAKDGGVYLHDTNHSIFTENSIVANVASDGSGIYMTQCFAVSLKDTIFVLNAGSGSGGAIFVVDCNYILFEKSNCTKNDAKNGGAAHVERSYAVYFADSNFDENSALSGNGGSLNIQTCTSVSITSSIFHENNARNGDGGAIYLLTTEYAVVNDCNFTSNHAESDGGTLYVGNSSYATISASGFRYGSSRDGAAIFMSSDFGLITGCEFDSNDASSTGGAVHTVACAATTIVDCNFLSNTAFVAGGSMTLFSSDSVSVINSTFTANQVFGAGGSFHLRDSNYTVISGCYFDSNFAGQDGGSVHLASHDHTVVADSTFIDNYVLDGDGGGVFSENSIQFTVAGCIFSMNVARRGGAIQLDRNGDNSVLSCLFSLNWADTGGSVYVGERNSIVVQYSIFESSHADRGGGAVYLVDMYNAFFSDCYFHRNDAASSDGAAIYAVTSGELVILDSNFSSNVVANQGGALYMRGLSISYVDGCHFLENIATREGGSVYYQTVAVAQLFNNTFVSNTASTGGAAYIGGCDVVLLDFCSFDVNYAEIDGGAVLFRDNGETAVHDSIFTANIGTSGGGVYAYSMDTILLSGCTFAGNSANSDDGGAVSFLHSQVIKIDRSKFINNSASNSGGALYFSSAEGVSVSASDFKFNAALKNGGAISIRNGVDIMFSDCDYISNLAKNNGGAFYVTFSNDGVAMEDSKFLSNVAGNGGGMIYLYYSDAVSIVGITAGSNAASANGGSIYLYYSNGVKIEESHFSSNSADGGGSLYLYYSRGLSLAGCSFASDRAVSDGGSVFLFYSKDISIRNTKFTSSTCGIDGGSVYLFRSLRVALHGCEFYSSSSLFGGSVYLYNSDNASLSNCAMHHSQADEGGGLYSYNSVGLSIQDSLFAMNSAVVGGGAFLILNGEEAIFHNCSFLQNSALFDGGSAVLRVSKDIRFTGCSFVSNSVVHDGGALYISECANFSFSDTLFWNNSAKHGGGAMHVAATKSLLVDKSNFTDNVVSLFGGAFDITLCDAVVIQFSHFYYNVVLSGSGSALWASGSDISISKENYFAHNSATRGGGTVYWEVQSRMVEPKINQRSFANNVALYGDNLATDGHHIEFSNSRPIVMSDYQTSTVAVTVLLEDYYNQTVRTDNVTYITMSTEPVFCKDSVPAYVAGVLQKPLGEGSAEFTSLQAFCAPEYTIPLYAKCTLNDRFVTTTLETNSSVYFVACSPGEVYDNNVCVECQNSYTFDGSTCKECPHHATHCQGNRIWAEDGYWRISDTSSTLLRCPMGSTSCGGGNASGNDLCLTGYEGPLCAVCSAGYSYRTSSHSCEDCSSCVLDLALFVSPLLFLLVLFGLAYVGTKLLLTTNFAEKDDWVSRILLIISETFKRAEIKETWMGRLDSFRLRFFARMKVHATLYQILLAAPFVLDLTFPVSFSTAMSSLRVLGMDMSSDSGVTCVWEMDYVDELLIQTLLPFGIAITLFVVYSIHSSFYKIRLSDVEDTSVVGTNPDSLHSIYIQMFLTLTYLLLTATVNKIFRMFPCHDVDPNDESSGSDQYLRADYSISCTSERYYFGVGWATTMIFVYAIGTPLLYWYLLYSSRNDIISRFTVKDVAEKRQIDLRLTPIRFLFISYKPEYWYWEIVDTVQRILLTGILCVINPGSVIQIVVAISFMLFFIKLYSIYCPYTETSISSMKSFTQWQIYTVYFIALLLRSDALTGAGYSTFLQMSLILAVVANLLLEAGQHLLSYTRHQCLGPSVSESELDNSLTENPMRLSKSTSNDSLELDGIRMSVIARKTNGNGGPSVLV